MRHETIRKIRWALGLSTSLLVVWVARSYLYHSAELGPAPASVPLLKPDVVKSSERVEYSETQGDRVVFRVSAQKFVQTSGGKNLLESVDAVNYGRNGERLDSIQSQSGQYDPKAKFVSFKGQVTIKTKEGDEIVTESLSYSKSEETARTEDRFLFRRGGLAGEGQGFNFNFRSGELQINRGADFRIESHPDPGNPAAANAIQIHSTLATLNRQYHFLFAHGASINQRNTRLEADEIELQFDEQGEALQALLARRSAQLTLNAPTSVKGDSQLMGGDSIKLQFEGRENRIQGIVSEGQAYFAFSRAAGPPIRLTAHRIDLALEKESVPKQLLASDDAEISQVKPESQLWIQGGGLKVDFQPGRPSPHIANFDRSCKMRFLSKNQLLELWASRMIAAFSEETAPTFQNIRAENATVWTYSDPGFRQDQIADFRAWKITTDFANQLNADRLEIDFEKAGNHPASMRGEPHCRLESRFMKGKERALRLINADRMRVWFVPGSSRFQSMDAGPGFQLKETIGSTNRAFRSDQAHAEFAAGSEQIRLADFQGGFQFEQGEVRAASDKAAYENTQDRIRLEGQPRLWDSQSETSAGIIEVAGQGAEIHGQGRVRSIFSNQKQAGLPFPTAGDKAKQAAEQGPVLVTSDELHADRDRKRLIYSGQAKASQAADYVRADILEIDQAAQVLKARGNMEMRLASTRKEAEGKRSSPVRATAGNMTYDKQAGRMALRDTVTLSDEDLTVGGAVMDIDFDPQTQLVSKMTAAGSIRILKNGWYGTGQETEYQLAEKRLVLTGKPAEIKDSEGRRSLGRRLTLNIADDTLSVEN